MHRWFMIPEHIMGVLSILIFIIFIQGVCIKKLIKAKKNNIDELIEKFRRFWGEFIIYILATSIIGLFIANLISEDNITLSDMNNWVSIILGFAAFMVGIISLWLSFYNIDKMLEAQTKSEKNVSDIKNSIDETIKSINKQTGWTKIDDDWVYLENGSYIKNEWRRSGNYFFYLNSDGKIAKNTLIHDNGNDYFVDSNGAMVMDRFINYEGKKLYFDEWGRRVAEGEKRIGSMIYFFKDGEVVGERMAEINEKLKNCNVDEKLIKWFIEFCKCHCIDPNEQIQKCLEDYIAKLKNDN